MTTEPARSRSLPCPKAPLFTVLLVLSGLLFLTGNLPAETPQERYQRLQKELESQKEKIERTKRREHSVLEDLDEVNKRLGAIEADIRRQRERVSMVGAEVRKVEGEISHLKKELEQERRWMKRKIRALQRYGQSGDFFFLFVETTDMSELLRRWRYLERITLYERDAIREYTGTLRTLDDKEKKLRGLHATLRKEEERLRLNESTLSEKKREKNVLLSSVRKERSAQEKMMKDLQEASRQLLETIRKLDEKDTYEGKGFSALKGQLGWPVSGRIALNYGAQKDPTFNTTVFRNGVYITTGDKNAKAVHSGKVVYADWFKGYGNLVIVNHGEGYHTLYGNLGEIFFKVGDIIKGRDAVGSVGSSGMLDAPSLYFEVRYKGKPLDPMQWLKRK